MRRSTRRSSSLVPPHTPASWPLASAHSRQGVRTVHPAHICLAWATWRSVGPAFPILQNAGGYTPEAARAAALQVLPDILHYDRTQPATYPNGRVPTDDVYSLRFAWLTNGKVPPAGLKPHDDLLAHFPYTGPPTPEQGGHHTRTVTPRSVRDNSKY
jgi:hypothetical protein